VTALRIIEDNLIHVLGKESLAPVNFAACISHAPAAG